MRREATIIVLILLSLQTRLSDLRTTLHRDSNNCYLVIASGARVGLDPAAAISC